MAVGHVYVFPGFLTPVNLLAQLFFPKLLTTFLTCFSRGERREYAEKKFCLNRVSNSQPPGHESDTLTIEPPGRGGDNTGFMRTVHIKINLHGKCNQGLQWQLLLEPSWTCSPNVVLTGHVPRRLDLSNMTHYPSPYASDK